MAGYFPDPDAMRAGDPAGFQAEVDTGAAARQDHQSTGRAVTVPAIGGPGSPMTHQDIVEYYGTRRAGVPNYRNEFAVMSREPWLQFAPHQAAPRLTIPLHINAHYWTDYDNDPLAPMTATPTTHRRSGSGALTYLGDFGCPPSVDFQGFSWKSKLERQTACSLHNFFQIPRKPFNH